MRSASSSASSGSCVTTKATLPKSRSARRVSSRSARRNGHVDVGEGLVEQQRARPRGKRARQCNALLLAAGERVRVSLGQGGQSHRLQVRVRDPPPFAGRQRAQPEGDVFARRQVREQHMVLKNQTHGALFRWRAPARRAERLAVQANGAGLHRLQTGRQAQQRRLAGTGRPKQTGDFPRRGGESDVAQHLAAGVAMADVLEDQTHGRGIVSGATSPSARRRTAITPPAATQRGRAPALVLFTCEPTAPSPVGQWPDEAAVERGRLVRGGGGKRAFGDRAVGACRAGRRNMAAPAGPPCLRITR